MKHAAHGVVMPPGVIDRIALSGDTQTMTIVSADPENGYDAENKPVPSDHLNVVVKYPDGYERHHQAKDLHDLLAKISGQLKNRYNLAAFEFTALPEKLAAGNTITVGGIAYVA